MSTKDCILVFDLARVAPPALASVVPRVFDELLAVFSPRALWASVDGEAHDLRLDAGERVGEVRCWRDETIAAGEPLSRCADGPARDLIDRLRAVIAGRDVSSLFVGAEGALRHRAPGTPAPAWYGRMVVPQPPSLVDLVSVRLEWDDTMRSFELGLPMSGYPLTRSRVDAGVIEAAGAPDAAAENRASILTALARAARVFGAAPGTVAWSVEGDYGGLYPDDAAELRAWLPRMDALSTTP